MNLIFPLILASKSTRRQQLMHEAGFSFTVKTFEVNESFPVDLPVEKVPEFLAIKKAKLFENEIKDEIVLTADTLVILQKEILGKPKDISQARKMLASISGTTHQVITGVCIFSEKKIISFSDLTEVTFKSLSDEEIDFYINHYSPFDKAGSYGIQEWIGMIGIEKIKGSYFNVVGLPIHLVYQHLKPYFEH